jgi:hypothetical protein
VRVLAFPGIARPVLLQEDPAAIQGLAAILSGWPPAERQDVAAEAALCALRLEPGGYHLTSAHLEQPVSGLGLAAALCGVVADLAQSHYEDCPGGLALHGGACLVGGRLLALVGPAQAGKSTLVARLSAEPDVTIFGDDVLPIGPDGLARALGIAPRLRLPLPRGAGRAFRRHVAAHLGPRDDFYGYLPTPNLAPHGAAAPLGVLLVLERRARGPARLHRLEEGEGLRHLLAHNMAPMPDPGAALALAEKVLASAMALRLVYSRLDSAVALLRQAFGDGLPLGETLAPPLPLRAPAQRSPPADPAQLWRRAPGVALRRQGQGAILWQPGGARLWQMNAVARAIWLLLETPASASGLAALLAEVFPGEAPARLRKDAAALLGDLAAQRLILPLTR